MHCQRGTALLLLLLLILGAGIALFFSSPRISNASLERDRITAQALAQAKNALIGYASGLQLSSTGSLTNAARPGDLPCPDLDDDGIAEADCGNGAGTTGQSKRLGRLPWKTLGIPDLRDGSGERLWYAVSSNYKERFRYASALNGTTQGTISLRDHNGNPDLKVGAGNGAIALIIAPGTPLIRPTSTGNATPYSQNRDAAGRNDPLNYLDLALGEDNADFQDGDDTNGFISGPVIDATGNVLLNDRVQAVTRQDLMPLLAKRVAGEVANCLNLYMLANGNRLPWMAPSTSYQGLHNTLAGFLSNPNSPGFDDTATDSSSNPMTTAWPGSPCSITASSGGNAGWYPNWADQVSVTIALHHQPQANALTDLCGVNGWSTNCVSTNKQFVVTVNIPPLSSITRSYP